MKQEDFKKLIELENVGGGFIPANQAADELLEQSKRGEIIVLQEVTLRDVKMHRGYFALLKFIYNYLPKNFKNKVRLEDFYLFVKHVKGDYEVVFEFKDGTKLVRYESIAFGNMSQKRFEAYVREQLPFIYENLIGYYYNGEIYDNIIKNIEEEFVKFLAQLSS